MESPESCEEKRRSSSIEPWGLGLPVGIALGAGVGAAFGNVGVGTAIGVSVGIGIGYLVGLSRSAKKGKRPQPESSGPSDNPRSESKD